MRSVSEKWSSVVDERKKLYISELQKTILILQFIKLLACEGRSENKDNKVKISELKKSEMS